MNSGRVIEAGASFETDNPLLHQILQSHTENLCGCFPHTAFKFNIHKTSSARAAPCCPTLVLMRTPLWRF